MNEKNKTHAQESKKGCRVHFMPPSITDEDIAVLFNGILGVIKRKAELDKQAEILNINLNNERLLKELHEKTNECNRLKNEIIYLKTQLNIKD